MPAEQTDAFSMPQGYYEVIVPRKGFHTEDAITFIKTTGVGMWAWDWMHGDERSAPKHERTENRFLFEDKETAAMFRLFYG